MLYPKESNVRKKAGILMLRMLSLEIGKCTVRIGNNSGSPMFKQEMFKIMEIQERYLEVVLVNRYLKKATTTRFLKAMEKDDYPVVVSTLENFVMFQKKISLLDQKVIFLTNMSWNINSGMLL